MLRGTAIYDSAGVLNGLLQALDSALEIEPRIEQGLMLHSPHWLEGSRVASQSGNHMPVYMGELVAKEFIVDLLGLVDLRENCCHKIDLFHQLSPFCGGQMKELCCVVFEHDNRPAGKELIFV